MSQRKRSDLRLKIPLVKEGEIDDNSAAATPKIIVEYPSVEQLPYFDEDSDIPGENTKQPIQNGLTKDEEFENYDSEPAPLPDAEVVARCANLRRNSISMPTGLHELQLEMLRQEHLDHPANIAEHRQGSDSTSLSGRRNESIEELNEILAEEKCAKIPLRNGRRKSVMANLGSQSPDQDTSTLESSDDDSPVNSITSINSLASLLKEKFQSIPSKIKKKPSDYKIKAFVGFIFLCIVFLIGFSYIMYHQQVLAREYFHRIKLNKASRSISILNSEGVEVLKGTLGTVLGSSKAYPCQDRTENTDKSICYEWLNGAKLYVDKIVNEEDDSIYCYMVKWQALIEGVYPTDCYDMTLSSDYHWYGGGQLFNMTWPLEKGTHRYAPFITGDTKSHQWGNALMRYFIISRGAAIIIDNETPLHISINQDDKKRFCLRAKYDDFAFVNRKTLYPELKYKICTNYNMKTLHSSLSRHSLWDGLKEDEINIMNSLLSEPIWNIASGKKHEINEHMMYNYTEEVVALGFFRQGHVLINEHWQNHTGDFTLDVSRFESLEDTINIIQRRGFKIVFSIQPFISTESKNFAECVQKQLLVSERRSDKRIPALTRYKSSASAGVLDITNNRTVPWLLEKINRVVSKYKINALFLDFGTAHDMPHYYQCERKLNNPDEYKTIFTESLQSLNLIGVSSAISLPRPPIFVSLPSLESTWQALKTIIPTILSYGIIGFPFVMPGSVGGDINIGEDEEDFMRFPNTMDEKSLPEKELYMRWLQLATFLPIMKFTHLPNRYNDEQVLEMAKVLTNLRLTTISPLFIKYFRQSLDTGLPLIRPLWMLELNDSACFVVDDEFSIGEELIAAPILEKGSTQREVYLPSGVWKDGIDGSLRKGNRWLHDYKVPIDKVAYFVKMPDNTRF